MLHRATFNMKAITSATVQVAFHFTASWTTICQQTPISQDTLKSTVFPTSTTNTRSTPQPTKHWTFDFLRRVFQNQIRKQRRRRQGCSTFGKHAAINYKPPRIAGLASSAVGLSINHIWNVPQFVGRSSRVREFLAAKVNLIRAMVIAKCNYTMERITMIK